MLNDIYDYINVEVTMKFFAGLIALASIVLAGCGGGGGGSNVSGSTTPIDYPLRTAYSNYVKSSGTVSYTISGTYNTTSKTTPVTGNGTETRSILQATTFEFNAAQLKTENRTGVIILNEIGTPENFTENSFFNSNYTLVGKSSVDYIVVTSPSQIPISVKVNDSGNLYSANRYSDSTRTKPLGTQSISYLIEAYSGENAYLTLVSTDKDLNGLTLSTSASKFIITPAGAMTKTSETTVSYMNLGASLTVIYKY